MIFGLQISIASVWHDFPRSLASVEDSKTLVHGSMNKGGSQSTWGASRREGEDQLAFQSQAPCICDFPYKLIHKGPAECLYLSTDTWPLPLWQQLHLKLPFAESKDFGLTWCIVNYLCMTHDSHDVSQLPPRPALPQNLISHVQCLPSQKRRQRYRLAGSLSFKSCTHLSIAAMFSIAAIWRIPIKSRTSLRSTAGWGWACILQFMRPQYQVCKFTVSPDDLNKVRGPRLQACKYPRMQVAI